MNDITLTSDYKLKPKNVLRKKVRGHAGLSPDQQILSIRLTFPLDEKLLQKGAVSVSGNIPGIQLKNERKAKGSSIT